MKIYLSDKAWKHLFKTYRAQNATAEEGPLYEQYLDALQKAKITGTANQMALDAILRESDWLMCEWDDNNPDLAKND